MIAAKNIPYVQDGNRFQTLSVYVPRSPDTNDLVGQPADNVGQPADNLPSPPFSPGKSPRWQVHIRGGAWRDPQLTASSIEATAAHALCGEQPGPLVGIVSLNYTLTHFPTHPTLPYDSVEDQQHTDLSRDAVHPQHVRDVLRGLSRVRALGLADSSYVLTGHSAGACLSLQAVYQAVYQAPSYWGIEAELEPPIPAAHVAINGLYDLPDLVHGLGASHEGLRAVYAELLGHAFGGDEAI